MIRRPLTPTEQILCWSVVIAALLTLGTFAAVLMSKLGGA